MICQFYDRYYPGSGGIETHIRDIVTNLPYDFEIVTDDVPGLPAEERTGSRVRISRFGPPNTVLSPEWSPWNARPLLPARALFDVLRLHRKRLYIRHMDSSLIHFHSSNIGPSLSKLLYLIRSRRLLATLSDWRDALDIAILTVHGLLSLVQQDSFQEEFEREFVSQFRRIICVDATVYERVLQFIEDVGSPARVWYVPNGVNTREFRPRPLSPGLPLRVGFVGRLERSRGVDFLVDIIRRQDPRFHFVVAGIGSARRIRQFETMVRGMLVDFHPNVPASQVPAFLSGIDLLVNPVIVPGISRVTLESMACGRPVIMSSLGDRRPIVDNETGFLTDHSAEGFYRTLDRLAQEPSLIARCGSKAAALVEREYSTDRMCDRIRNVYEEAIHEGA